MNETAHPLPISRQYDLDSQPKFSERLCQAPLRLALNLRAEATAYVI